MSITLGAVSLLSAVTHQMPREGDYIYQPQDVTFYGVPGSVSIDDAEHGRPIMIEVTLSGYATRELLKTAVEVLDARKTTLNDLTLVVVCGSDTLSYNHVSFRGLQRAGTPQYDGSGVNGWRQDGTMIFQQLKRTA